MNGSQWFRFKIEKLNPGGKKLKPHLTKLHLGFNSIKSQQYESPQDISAKALRTITIYKYHSSLSTS
jgi:hypothetical protein